MVNRVLTAGAALAAAGSLALVPVAGAKPGDKSFAQTYPYASALCVKVAAGQTPKQLKSNEAQVKQACTKLQGAFGPLQAAVQTANTQFVSGIQSQRASVKAACQPGANKAACQTARRNARLAIASLRTQHRAAVKLFYTSIEANRRTFWATIRSLRGGSSIKPDQPIPPKSG